MWNRLKFGFKQHWDFSKEMWQKKTGAGELICKGLVIVTNYEFKLGEEGREGIKGESDCENVVKSMYFRFHQRIIGIA